MKKKPVCCPDACAVMLLLFTTILIFDGCKKNGAEGRSAMGRLEHDKGNCLPAVVNGIWYSGAAADTNYVEIGVNVTRTGNYRIVSDVQNGVEFADSGVFNTTGLQTVRLKAIGAFTSADTTFFTISFDNSICGFSVDVQDLPLADNMWRFTARGRTYSGPCGSQQFFSPNDLGSTWVIVGPVASGEDTLLSIQVFMPPDGYDVVPGTYYTNAGGGYFDFYERIWANVSGHQIFLASQDRPDKVFTIVVSGFGTAKDGSRMILGSFSGTAVDSTGADVKVSNGAFRVGGTPILSIAALGG